MKVQYTRVSTIGQKTDRQIVQGLKVYEDKISGSIAFKDRPKAKQLLRDIDNGLVMPLIKYLFLVYICVSYLTNQGN